MDTWLGTRSLVFWANRSFFAKEWANERFAQKNELWLIHSFLVSDLSDHHSLKKREWANRSFFKNKKTYKIYDFSQILSWATWLNPLWLLIFHDRPERFAHSRSFDMSYLSDSLTVAHLSWAIWVNCSQTLIWYEQSEQMSDERMRKFPGALSG